MSIVREESMVRCPAWASRRPPPRPAPGDVPHPAARRDRAEPELVVLELDPQLGDVVLQEGHADREVSVGRGHESAGGTVFRFKLHSKPTETTAGTYCLATKHEL